MSQIVSACPPLFLKQNYAIVRVCSCQVHGSWSESRGSLFGLVLLHPFLTVLLRTPRAQGTTKTWVGLPVFTGVPQVQGAFPSQGAWDHDAICCAFLCLCLPLGKAHSGNGSALRGLPCGGISTESLDVGWQSDSTPFLETDGVWKCSSYS